MSTSWYAVNDATQEYVWIAVQPGAPSRDRLWARLNEIGLDWKAVRVASEREMIEVSREDGYRDVGEPKSIVSVERSTRRHVARLIARLRTWAFEGTTDDEKAAYENAADEVKRAAVICWPHFDEMVDRYPFVSEYSHEDCGGPEACSGCSSWRHGIYEDGSADPAAIDAARRTRRGRAWLRANRPRRTGETEETPPRAATSQ